MADRRTTGLGPITVSIDPRADFVEIYDPARRASDWATQVDAAVMLSFRTAHALMRRIDVPIPERTNVVRLVALVKAEVPGRLDRLDMSRQPIPPATALTSLYRAVWWLAKSHAHVREFGALAEGAPYNGVDHLMTCILDDCMQLLVTCPPPTRTIPQYAAVSHVGPLSSATIVDFELAEDLDELSAMWWQPAQSLVRVGEWDVRDVMLDEACGWADVVHLSDVEIEVYSTPFRDAVESARRPGDTHAWLPVGIVGADERRQYWLLNVWGAGAEDTWGLRDDLAGDRTVVLPYAGDGWVLFANRAQAAVDQAGLQVEWRPAR